MKVVLLLLLFSALAYATVPLASRNLIRGLPDAPAIPNKISSGYIPINDDRQIFYIFVESSKNPASDPVLLWTNGGPGCSGLIGAFTEIGPYVPLKNGTLGIRRTSWTNFANMLFIEQPAGVGFSINKKPMTFDDEKAATDNYILLQNFFKAFPEFKSNPLFLTSESYGGHYLPTLAKKMIDDPNLSLNFKGFAVGNPLIYLPYRDFGEIATYGYHQMFPKKEFDEYLKTCTPDLNKPPTNPPPPRDPSCDAMESKLSKHTANTDPYALDFPICTGTGESVGATERAHFLKYLQKARLSYNGFQSYFPDNYEPCTDNYLTKYLNRKDVRRALNVPDSWTGTWSECGNIDFLQSDLITEMMTTYEYIANKMNGSVKVLIFSGDDDSICSTIESQFALSKISLNVESHWEQWLVDGQLGGFITKYEKGFQFATVHGAGHMSPATRPDHVYKLIRDFVTAN